MHLTKRDAVTIVILSTIFLGLAAWNLGFTQSPTTTATFSSGQNFFIDLGAPSDVDSVFFLLKDGSYNLTVYAGSPENWWLVSGYTTFSDYYKWSEVGIHQTTEFIRADFGQSNPDAIIAEVAVTNSLNQQIQIVNITGLDFATPNLHNLIDEQDEVHIPFTYMSQTYFDEFTFARSAEQYLHLQLPYEWTHPPLGKLIQAVGIAVFGLSPFGWRFMGVIFGTLMIPLMYVLGKKLLGSWIGGFAAAFLLTFDFMHFTMARMGTADTYVAFFSLASQLFFFIYFANVIKKGWGTSVFPLFLAVICFSLSFSTKWFALYGALGMLALLAALRLREVAKRKESPSRKFADFFNHPFLLLVGFVGVAIGVYFLIYVPDMLAGRPLFGSNGNGVVDLQFAMYNYHSTLSTLHLFSSAWWSWPFMVSPHGYVPICFEVSYLSNNRSISAVSTISAMGNPAVWWVGFACMLLVIDRVFHLTEAALFISRRYIQKFHGIKNKFDSVLRVPYPIRDMLRMSKFNIERNSQKTDFAATFIAVVFLFSWIPYVFISRTTFIYHFYISVPFLCLASAYLINKVWNTRWGKVVTIFFFVSVVAMFVIFYPVISGMPVSTSWIYKLKWFTSWFFAP